ncbi:UPF0764 protein C16orf89-like protein [Trichoplax sp. H2]|nr:UPF0764 protein C16orf89-like protein [Trichoplax sp. H2]|eukprot:RDD37314.1 UPF0764 protein C16orf89-like protein [Trichoplax sp. H2]
MTEPSRIPNASLVKLQISNFYWYIFIVFQQSDQRIWDRLASFLAFVKNHLETITKDDKNLLPVYEITPCFRISLTSFISLDPLDYRNGVSTLNPQQINRVERIYNRIVAVSKRIKPILANNSTPYSSLQKIVQKPVPVAKQLVKLDFTELYNVSSDETLSEFSGYMNISDICIMSIIGSKKVHLPVCTISDTCWAGITNYHSGYYSITHQLLTIFHGQQLNCTDKMNKLAKNSGGIQRVKQILCTQVYHQMQKELKKGLKNIQIQDLFLEQIFVCGGLGGYEQFLKPQYLSMILKWQTKDGCFTPYYGPFVSLHPKFIVNRTRNAGHYLSSSHQLRTNLITPDGCYQHRTSIAFGLISVYLYWNSLSNQSPHLLTTTMLTNASPKWVSVSITIHIIDSIAIGFGLVVIMIIISTVIMYFLFSRHRRRHVYRKLSTNE